MTSFMQTDKLPAKAPIAGAPPEMPSADEREVEQQVQALAVRLGWERWTYQICIPQPDMRPKVLTFHSAEPNAVGESDAARFDAQLSEACLHPDWQDADPAGAGQDSNVGMQVRTPAAHAEAVWSVPVIDASGVRGLFVCAGRRPPEDAGEARRQRADAGWVGEFCHRAMANILVVRHAPQLANAT